MTGFAKQTCEAGEKRYTIEIKTLNSKNLDINIRIPATLHSKELELRSQLSRLERGKIDVFITEENTQNDSATLNGDLLTSRFQQAQQLAQQLGCHETNLLQTLLTMPDLWASATDTDIPDSEWTLLSQAFDQAIDLVQQFRLEEGTILAADFVKHVDLIEQKLNAIPPYENERIDTAKERIRRYFAESAIK